MNRLDQLIQIAMQKRVLDLDDVKTLAIQVLEHEATATNLAQLLKQAQASLSAAEKALTAAESRGREQGLREALRLAGLLAVQMESFVGDESYSVANAAQDVRMLEAAILSLIPSPTVEKGEERCEWVSIASGSYQYTRSCGGRTWCGPAVEPYCSNCGKPITIK